MPSDFQKILLDMQKDLNAITICALAANNALASMLSTYEDSTEEFSPFDRARSADNWAKALSSLTDSLDSFGKNGLKLQEYIDGQR